jgi:hypothetical protein
VKRFRFRRRWMGHKHGVARGVVVYGSPGFRDSDGLSDLMLRCNGLRRWAADHDVTLDDGPGSLTRLDEHLDSWNSDSSHHGSVDLSNEVGKYLGAVILTHAPGSQWKVWPNGHPVIRLSSGKELDVTRLSSERLNNSGMGLTALFNQAQTS